MVGFYNPIQPLTNLTSLTNGSGLFEKDSLGFKYIFLENFPYGEDSITVGIVRPKPGTRIMFR